MGSIKRASLHELVREHETLIARLLQLSLELTKRKQVLSGRLQRSGKQRRTSGK